MPGDNRIGPKVNSVTRVAPVRVDESRTALPAKLRDITSRRTEPSTRLASLTAAIASLAPPIESARIAPIHDALASGAYRLDANATAKAMARFFARQDGV